MEFLRFLRVVKGAEQNRTGAGNDGVSESLCTRQGKKVELWKEMRSSRWEGRRLEYGMEMVEVVGQAGTRSKTAKKH